MAVEEQQRFSAITGIETTFWTSGILLIALAARVGRIDVVPASAATSLLPSDAYLTSIRPPGISAPEI